jgi:hypothetical protein
MSKTELTAERLRELLNYDPETGVFTRLVRAANKKAGDRAGCARGDGYLLIRVSGSLYLAHRLAWFYVHGAWPANKIDHIDGVRDNNRIDNLRDATDAVNSQNIRSARAGSASGLLGASKHKRSWSATIETGGVRHRLGTFSTPELAHGAYLGAKRNMHEGCTI